MAYYNYLPYVCKNCRATIPILYRDLYDKCSTNCEPIEKEIYQMFLSQCNLESSHLKIIWDLVGPSKESQGVVSRTNFYKTLALIAWAQQGKEISAKLFDSFTGNEYPCPKINSLTPVAKLKEKSSSKKMPSNINNISYQKIVQIDSVHVQLVPEKKGLFLKHSEYLVCSKKFGSKVTRRYNDFVALHELLLNRFPYRLIPSLPPKKILINNSQFLEERARGLHRWLTLICRHPIISQDGLTMFFLTDGGSDIQHRIRNMFRKLPDEFMTSDLAANSKEMLPNENSGQIGICRENIRSLVNTIGRLKQDMESLVEQRHNEARDVEDISTQLKNVITGHTSFSSWSNIDEITKKLHSISLTKTKQANIEEKSVCEKLSLLYDILVAHKDLCERLEKGLTSDHQIALAKLLALKKKKLQNAIGSVDSESVEQLEAKMLAQENIITNIDLRTDFSLYCVNVETQLVFAYLDTMPSIINTFIDLNASSHFEFLNLWRDLQMDQQTLSMKANGV